MTRDWIHTILAGLTGAGGIKIFDIAYQEYRDRRTAQTTAKDVIVRHLDPILKAANELFGKIRSLALHDFEELLSLDETTIETENAPIEIVDFLFLCAQFWSRLEIFRRESLFVRINMSDLGRKLGAFLETLESRGVRIADRAFQRGMGEALMRNTGAQAFDSMTFYEFAENYIERPQLRFWFGPLRRIISQLNQPTERQSILVYGAVLHAMLDTLDPKHLLGRERDGFVNKLSRKNRKDLRFRVFGIYLPFVRDIKKYAGSKK